MTNSQIPYYSGVTINITNPTVNANPSGGCHNPAAGYAISSQQNQEQRQSIGTTNPIGAANTYTENYAQQNQTYNQAQGQGQAAYPSQYYLNNYNYQNNIPAQNPNNNELTNQIPQTATSQELAQTQQDYINQAQVPNQPPVQNQAEVQSQGLTQAPSQELIQGQTPVQNQNQEQEQAQSQAQTQAGAQGQEQNLVQQDMSSSQEIIQSLNEQVEKERELEEKGKQTRVVNLTDEYIMSLENYLNNENSEIRLMAAKEVLTRLDEDKNRYNDAALNALLNKMLQDPNKLVRIAALSALSSGLASGNDYTVQLLNNIQQNPDSSKEDVVEAANILLKMSAETEVRYVNQDNNAAPQQKPEQ